MDTSARRATPADRATPRSPALVASELREIRRYLRDAPPHHGAGHREALLVRLAALERELAGLRARSAAASGGPQA